MHGDLSELYQEVILDHSKQPRNYRELDGASNVAKGHAFVASPNDRAAAA